MKQHKDPFSAVEKEILNLLWANKELKVRELHEKIKKKHKVALTSIAVYCDRLHQKGYVDRKIVTGRGGSRYIYFPLKDKKQFEESIVKSTVDKLIESYGESAVSYFNERFGK